MIEEASIDPIDAAENGLIDEVANFDTVSERDFSRARIKVLNPKLFPHPYLNIMASWLQ